MNPAPFTSIPSYIAERYGVKIKKVHFLKIVEHSREEYPKEACGILAGKNNSATKVYKMTNTSESPTTCYFMDPREQFKVFKEMRTSGREMLAIYHSHVATSAHPSQRDVKMAYYPEAGQVIISLADFNKPDVRSFKIVEGKIEEEEIEIVK